MRCRRLQRCLLALLEGELTQKQCQKAEAHVAVCARCAAVLQSTKQTLRMLRAVEVPEPEEAYWETFLPGLQQRIRQEETVSQRRHPLWRWPWPAVPRPVLAALAASLLIVSALPLMHGVWKQPPPAGGTLLGGAEASLVADLDFLKHLDLLEDVDVLDDADASR